MTVRMPIGPACGTCGSLLARGLCPRCLLDFGLSPEPVEVPALRDASPPLALLGDYELLEEIGRGGMGIVYRARQLSLGRTVAVKLLPFGGLGGADSALRLRAEAVAAGSLRHPHIVAVHEVGRHQGQDFLAMDYVAGPSLARVLRDGPLSVRRAATLVRQVALAVQHAHERGIIHRDLKPSNILLDAGDDEPRITDFGLAKNLRSDTQLTLSGQTLGSPNYIPPEQIRGSGRSEAPSPAASGAQNAGQDRQAPVIPTAPIRKVSFASDVYALGAVLYHALTGRPPFQGEDIADVLRQVVYEEPLAPSRLIPSIPADLEIICLKCLEKEPSRRYAAAQALADDLGCFLNGQPIHARRVGRPERVLRWCSRNPVAASLGTATLILSFAIVVGSPVAIYRINLERQRAERGELAARQRAYASDMNLVQQAVQASEFGHALRLLDGHRPDGNATGEKRREAGGQIEPTPESGQLGIRHPPLAPDLRGWEWRYWWRQCKGGERFILGKHADGATAVGLLPDGKTVFSAGRDHSVRLWDLESRRQIGVLPHAEEVTGAAASADSRWLATTTCKDAGAQPVLLWDLATRKVAALLTRRFQLRSGSIAFSQDSHLLVFATHFGGVRLWDVNARDEIANLPAVADAPPGPLGVAISPDGRTIAYNENEGGAVLLWDVARRLVIGRLTGHQGVVRALAFSPDGSTLASCGDDGKAWLWNLADGRQGPGFTNPKRGFTCLAFSSDSQTLALSGGGASARNIRIVDVGTGRQKAELRGHLGDVSSLAFTPDGQTVLSASDDGTVRVWDPVPLAVEKSAHVFAENLPIGNWRVYGPALCLSPDGRHLLTVYTDQTFSIWDTLRLAEGERHPLPFTNTMCAAVASGRSLAAFGRESGEVMLWDAETGRARFLGRHGASWVHRLAFSPDGRYLASADNTKVPSELALANDTRQTVRVWDVGAGKEPRVLSTDGKFVTSLAFSADGKTLMAGLYPGSVRLWSLDGPGGTAELDADSVRAGTLALLPGGTTLVSAGGDIRFWEVRTRQENAPRLSPRSGEHHRLALSPDGLRLAGAGDGWITIWDVASHQELATLQGHDHEVLQLAFTPDGDHLVSASKDQLRVWRAASWPEIESARRQAGK